MIKLNIKITIVAIVSFMTFWLVLFNFIKVDVSTLAVVSQVDALSQITIDSKTASYIENHSIDSIKVNYQNQYYWCSISLLESGNDYYNYSISLPDSFDKEQQWFSTTIIADKLNVYQYLLKK